MVSEAIARQAGVENGDLPAGAAELQCRGKAGKAAADDDDVIHGIGVRVLYGRGLGLRLAVSRARARRCRKHSYRVEAYSPARTFQIP
ncbi:hypothetical protein D3C86_1405650 [compost metagenome]